MLVPAMPARCSCCSVEVTGCECDPSRVLASASDRVRRNPNPFLQVRNGSVAVSHMHLIDWNQTHTHTCQLRCLNCGGILDLHFARGCAYAQFASNERTSKRRLSDGPAAAIPAPVARLIRIKETSADDAVTFGVPSEPVDERQVGGSDNDVDIDDGDYDLMFSSTRDIVVGAFQHGLAHELAAAW
jgi:hypothetical protein